MSALCAVITVSPGGVDEEPEVQAGRLPAHFSQPGGPAAPEPGPGSTPGPHGWLSTVLSRPRLGLAHGVTQGRLDKCKELRAPTQ